MFRYKTRGTCSSAILIETEGDIIKSVKFEGGCAGNTQGIARLVVGMTVEDTIRRLKGIQCRGGTSCPDQLALALTAMKQQVQ